jgi:hypothetical protein
MCSLPVATCISFTVTLSWSPCTKVTWIYGLTIILLKEDVIFVCADAATAISENNTVKKDLKRCMIICIDV